MSGHTVVASDMSAALERWEVNSSAPIRTLIVDDDVSIQEVFTTILQEEGYAVCCVSSAEAALDLLTQQAFDLVMVDIVMPGMDGFCLLHHINRLSPELPVVLITGNANVEMARRALTAGASDFVTKPCNVMELPIILERNLTRQALARRRTQSYRNELQNTYETVLGALLSALDTHDTETKGHSERVTAYTMLLADLMGISQEQLYHIERGALLHDIGKIGIPDHILLKPGPLTALEYAEMKKHPVIGFRMCARIEFLKGAARIVLHHHERWDGDGYPDGLAGGDIPLGARIFAVADAFDAMTTDRPYRRAMTCAQAREEIFRHSGSQFDPGVVQAFHTIPEARWQQIRALSRW